MKNFKYTEVILLTLFFAFTMLNAQETNEKKSTRVGIGISIIDINDVFGFIFSQGVSQSSAFCLTIDTSPGFRIEPEFGYFVYSVENKNNGYTSETTLKSIRLGTGLFAKKWKNTDYHIYYGLRLGYIYSSEESKFSYPTGSDSDKESSSGFYFAPALGGEYLFSDYFSLGGETQLMYSSASFEDDDDPDEETTISTFSAKAIIYLRFYF